MFGSASLFGSRLGLGPPPVTVTVPTLERNACSKTIRNRDCTKNRLFWDYLGLGFFPLQAIAFGDPPSIGVAPGGNGLDAVILHRFDIFKEYDKAESESANGRSVFPQNKTSATTLHFIYVIWLYLFLI